MWYAMSEKKIGVNYDNYKSVQTPLPDVYRLGGHTVFGEFGIKASRPREPEKNLLWLPKQVVNSLRGYVLDGSKGAEAALDELAIITADSSLKNWNVDEHRHFLYRATDTLDVLLTDYETHKEFDPEEFFTKVASRTDLAIPKDKLNFVTRESVNKVLAQMMKYSVEKPRYLLTNEDIIREGIVQGSNELRDAISVDRKAGLSLEDAAEFNSGNLPYLNQFISFERREQDDATLTPMARVTGNITRNKSGKVLYDAPRVIMLEDHEMKKENRPLRVGKWETHGLFGINPRDTEQYLALQHCLLNPNIDYVFIHGIAGSGKTLLAYAAAMDQVLHFNSEALQNRMPFYDGKGDRPPSFYKRMLLLKETGIVGGKKRDIGFLPGDMLAKLKPFLIPFRNAHEETILGNYFDFNELFYHPKFQKDFEKIRSKDIQPISLKGKTTVRLPPDHEVVELTYSGYLRGVSIAETFILVDETQNYTPGEVKLIMTRVAEGSKIVFMGDTTQIDNPDCSIEYNGFSWGIKNFIGDPDTAVIHLPRSYRMRGAGKASTLQTFDPH